MISMDMVVRERSNREIEAVRVRALDALVSTVINMLSEDARPGLKTRCDETPA